MADTDTETVTTSHVDWLLEWLQTEKGLPPELALRIVYKDRAIAHPTALVMRNDPIVVESAATFAAARARGIVEVRVYGENSRRWYDYCFCGGGPAPIRFAAPHLNAPGTDIPMVRTTVAHTQRVWESDAWSIYKFHRNPCDCGRHKMVGAWHCSVTTLLYRMWSARHGVVNEFYSMPMGVCHAFGSRMPHISYAPEWFRAQPTATLRDWVLSHSECSRDDLEDLAREQLLMHALGWEHFRVPEFTQIEPAVAAAP